MKKLYYVVDIQFEDVDGFIEGNGWKTITLYEIKDGELKALSEFEGAYSDDSVELIKDHLTDNDFGVNGDELALVRL